MTSLPPSPQITSRPGVPRRTSGPVVPVIVQWTIRPLGLRGSGAVPNEASLLAVDPALVETTTRKWYRRPGVRPESGTETWASLEVAWRLPELVRRPYAVVRPYSIQ